MDDRPYLGLGAVLRTVVGLREGVYVGSRLGVPFLARDVFLDDAATEFADPGGAPGALEIAWERGIALAKKRGQAIVIAHPRKETLVFLSEKIGLLGKEGPRLVRVSELVP